MDNHPAKGNVHQSSQRSGPDEARVRRYAALIHEASGCDGCPVHPEDIAGARAVIAAADEEQAELRADARREFDLGNSWMERALAAEAEVERLYRGIRGESR